MKIAYIITGICAACLAVMTADAIWSDFGTWNEYRAEIKYQKEQISKLEKDLLEYQRTVTRMTAAQ